MTIAQDNIYTTSNTRKQEPMTVSWLKPTFHDSEEKSLANNFLSLIILRGFQFLIPLITLPYLVKVLGIENYGLVSMALSLSLYFGAVIQFGFGVTATHEIARHRDDPIKIAKIYSTTLAASIILAMSCTAVFCTVVLYFDKFNVNFKLYMLSITSIAFQSIFPIWFFQGMEKMRYVTYLSMVTSTALLICLFLLVKKESDFLLVPLLHAVTALSTFIVSIVLIKKKFKVGYIPPEWKELKDIYVNGRHAFIYQLAPNLYNNSTVFLLGIFTNHTMVGLYTAATKLIDAVISLGYVFSNSFLPYLSRNMDKHKAFQKIMFISGLLLTLLTFITSDVIAKFLFGENSIEVSLYIRWLAICIFLVFISLTYGTNYLMLVGQGRIAKNVSLYTSVSFFIFALVVIPFFEIWGAICTLLGARLSIALLQYIYYFRYSRLVNFPKHSICTKSHQS